MKKDKKLPPYAGQLRNLINTGYKLKNDLYVCIGEDSWSYAKNHIAAGNISLALPNDDLPQDYNWQIVKNLSVLVIATSEVSYQLVRQLAYELLRAGACIVRAISQSGALVIFRRGGGK